jgi:hypothetical protein
MDVLSQSSGPYPWANVAFSLILVVPAGWILRNLSFKKLVAALEFLKALREFEGEDRNGINQATSS